MVTQPSILEVLRAHQKMVGSKISVPDSKSRIAFVFPTKDRVECTKKTLATIDTEKGFDLIWIDGSEMPEGKALPDKYKLYNIRLIEVHKNVKGKEYACYLGLERLFELGYEYFGLIENELVFEPGWFQRLLKLFHFAAEDGLAVGSATVRNYNGRVIEYRTHYTINWNIGAGMSLYSRVAAEISLLKMRKQMTARRIRHFYAETLGIELGEAIFRGRPDRIMCSDWTHETALYQHGLAAVGSIPSLAHELILDVRRDIEDSRVEQAAAGRGLVRKRISRAKLQWIRFTNPLFPLGWYVLKKVPWLYRAIQRGIAQRYQKKTT